MTYPLPQASHDWVAERLIPIIQIARREGRRISVTDEVRRIAREPGCRFREAEIREEILLLAVRERVPMELDSLSILDEPPATD